MTTKTTKQYRVTFTHLDNVNGNVVRVKGGSRWFNSRKEAEESHWVSFGKIRNMSMDDAQIVTREIEA